MKRQAKVPSSPIEKRCSVINPSVGINEPWAIAAISAAPSKITRWH
ncbi:MAG: hypothetical protein HRT36_07425 [Alphaproteobacteria bacterium]|nr:hypothetical protein [Alphaproteobacteria bacterium]